VKHELKDEVEAEDSPSSTSLRVILPAAFASPLTRPHYPLLHQIRTETSATLTLNPSVLPLSTERLLVITAPSPHAISLAVQRISEYLQSSYEHYASIQNGAKPPVVYYVPLPVYGTLGAPENYDLPRVIEARMMTPQNPYGVNPKQPLVPQQAVAAAVAGGAVGAGGMAPQAGAAQAGQVYQQGPTQVPGPTVGAQPHGIQPAVVGPGGQLTQQIFIPNDMVGAIIGKGGAKINEIRQMSGSHMYVSPLLSSFMRYFVWRTVLIWGCSKINEPAENSNERLVTITGTQDANQMALYLLYTRLETEKHRM
jgi:heterogeneous nuclear rnp K-like protein